MKRLKEIGNLLKEKRKENGVSQEEAAEDLNIDVSALENIEEGNTRAFKDMYTLKELIKDYAKYLGVDVNDVVEEFNDFLFEHTSKISLDDIKEVREKTLETEEKKVISPYTKIPKPKKDYKKPIKFILIILLILCAMILLLIFLQKENKRSVELKMREDAVYEFAK